MPFTPGQSGNPTGRPKGSANTLSVKIRQTIAEFVAEKSDTLEEIYNGISSPDEKAKFLLKLLPFIIPKQTEVVEPEPPQEYDWSRIPLENRIKLMEWMELAAVTPMDYTQNLSKLSDEDLKTVVEIMRKAEEPVLPKTIPNAI